MKSLQAPQLTYCIAWFLAEVFFTYGMSCWEFGSLCFLVSVAVQ